MLVLLWGSTSRKSWPRWSQRWHSRTSSPSSILRDGMERCRRRPTRCAELSSRWGKGKSLSSQKCQRGFAPSQLWCVGTCPCTIVYRKRSMCINKSLTARWIPATWICMKFSRRMGRSELMWSLPRKLRNRTCRMTVSYILSQVQTRGIAKLCGSQMRFLLQLARSKSEV